MTHERNSSPDKELLVATAHRLRSFSNLCGESGASAATRHGDSVGVDIAMPTDDGSATRLRRGSVPGIRAGDPCSCRVTRSVRGETAGSQE